MIISGLSCRFELFEPGTGSDLTKTQCWVLLGHWVLLHQLTKIKTCWLSRNSGIQASPVRETPAGLPGVSDCRRCIKRRFETNTLNGQVCWVYGCVGFSSGSWSVTCCVHRSGSASFLQICESGYRSLGGGRSCDSLAGFLWIVTLLILAAGKWSSDSH